MASPRFTPTLEMIQAAGLVLQCMAWVQVVKPQVRGYQAAILAELGYPGYDLEHTYMLPDEVFARFHARCKEERDKAGLKVDDPEFCPLLVANNALMLAQHAMLDLMEPVTQISWHQCLCSANGLENLRQYVDLTLRLLAPFCKVAPRAGGGLVRVYAGSARNWRAVMMTKGRAYIGSAMDAAARLPLWQRACLCSGPVLLAAAIVRGGL